MIRIDNITKIINNNKILNNITINFRPHELVCILGQSGSGKTTLLNLIGNNDTPTTGNIYLGKTNIKNICSHQYHNQIISYIFQDYNLIKNLSLKDNIELPLKLTNKKIYSEKLTKLITKLNIDKIITKKVKYLSGGEKQRVAITRTILTNTKIILADEPTGALDSFNSENIMQILKDLSKHKLVIVVTHNQELAKKYATRIIEIKDGKIKSDSNPCHKIYNYHLKPQKLKLKCKEIIKICINNIRSKLGRNILKILAFSISTFFLSLILSINQGLNKEINNLNQNNYYTYPLIISSYSYDKYNLKNQTHNTTEININKYTIKNNIDNKLINTLKSLDKNTYSGISYSKRTENNNLLISNPSNNLFKIIKGTYPQNNNEVMLLLDNNNSIDEELQNYLNIHGTNYNDYLNKIIFINSLEVKITAIAKSNNEYLSSLNGIVYNPELINTKIESISIYPKTKEGKEKIKKVLNKYQIVDEAQEITDIINRIIKIITYVLIIFSISAFTITIIMMNIMSYIEVIERKKEIGILKTLGTRNKDIKRIFIFENILVGFISTIISLLNLYIFSKIINPIINTKIGLSSLITINIKTIIIIFIVSFIISKISSYIPSIIASKKKITDILR